jgi:hypothetical protein
MKRVFGGLIAIVLLGLYTYAVGYAIEVVNCASTKGCQSPPVDYFTDGFALTMTTVGGLVSALVIAVLAVTKPGDAPVMHALGPSPSANAVSALKILTGAYLLVWVLVGLAAFVVGTMWHPGVLKPLTDLGQSWLGLAVAAGYAYFGIAET